MWLATTPVVDRNRSFEMTEIIVKKTPAVADEIGVSYVRLYNLLRYRKIDPPARDTSGDFVWSPKDVDAAQKAIQTSEK
jgi:hypothetical protein